VGAAGAVAGAEAGVGAGAVARFDDEGRGSQCSPRHRVPFGVRRGCAGAYLAASTLTPALALRFADDMSSRVRDRPPVPRQATTAVQASHSRCEKADRLLR